MISVRINKRCMIVSGHADEGETEADNCGICAFVSITAQSCAMWTEDNEFLYDDGSTQVLMPDGDVRDFVIASLQHVARAWPKLLSVEVTNEE